MILYFSGTGNTRYVTEELSRLLNDEVAELTSNGQVNSLRLILAFPVYAWGIPPYVKSCIRNLKTSPEDLEVYMVVTCGDDIGLTAMEFKKLALEKCWNPKGAFSVQMPNNYVFLPGFDVDSSEKASLKLAQAPDRIKEIASKIEHSHDAWTEDVVTGKYPWIKSKILRLWFHKRAMNPNKFHASHTCVKCGICAKICPLNNINIDKANGPKWGKNCAFCLRCYHSCPNHSIDYNNRTLNKGQYLFPSKK